MESPAAKSQAVKPQPAVKDLAEEQLPAIENLNLSPPKIKGSDKEYIEKLRALEDAWGHIHRGVQGRSNTLKELRTDFSDFKKEVQAVEKLLKSRK